MNFSRIFHTLRYLKPVQFYGRLWARLYRPRPDLSAPPAVVRPEKPFILYACSKPYLTGPLKFCFLNKEHEIENPMNWNVQAVSRLWEYCLHYFDDLTAFGWETRRQWHEKLIRGWIQGMMEGMMNAECGMMKKDFHHSSFIIHHSHHSVGWEPYPLSRRIINWIKADLASPLLDDIAVHSLAIQSRYLAKSCEYHIQGNHLIANAVALIFAGFYFGALRRQREAAGWLKKGLNILCSEISEQIKPDGSHYEQSPSYHALCMKDILDVIQLGTIYNSVIFEPYREIISRMTGYLNAVCHPDREIALFNDSAFGLGPAPQALIEYVLSLDIAASDASIKGRGYKHFHDSGLVRLENEIMTVLFDTGAIGPDHQPGHAHADNLTIEASWKGKRFIVDSGTGEYGYTKERQYQRSTYAHNTVVIDEKNSSDVWAEFRVGHRAKPCGKTLAERRGNYLICRAGHDGYQNIAGHPVHFRTIFLNNQNMIVEDEITGTGEHLIEVIWHFHPDICIIQDKSDILLSYKEEPICRLVVDNPNSMLIKDSTYYPGFGIAQPNKKIVLKYIRCLPKKILSRFIYN